MNPRRCKRIKSNKARISQQIGMSRLTASWSSDRQTDERPVRFPSSSFYIDLSRIRAVEESLLFSETTTINWIKKWQNIEFYFTLMKVRRAEWTSFCTI